MFKNGKRVIDLEDLVYSLNYAAKHCELGIGGIAENSGQRQQTLRNKLSLGDVSHQPTLGDFVMVVKQSNDTTPVDLLCAMFDGQFVSRTDQSSDTIMAAVLKAMSEQGDIAAVLDDILADGVIDDAEFARFTREILEARNALQQVQNTVMRYREQGNG